MNKLVSIIVLTYNSEKYINNCLESIKQQTYSNIEVLVIDNGSSDNTVSKIRNSKFEISNFKFIENSINLGCAGGNNLGIEESRGEYVVILNPDVVLDENYIKIIVTEFEKNSKIGSIQGKYYQLNNGIKTKIIDTVGFKFFESGRIIDEGQGDEDIGQYEEKKDVLKYLRFSLVLKQKPTIIYYY